jgi:uncharacterized protein (TIGR02118 family)
VIKVVALIRRNPALTPEAFRDYWTNVHVPMIKEHLPSLVRYTGSFPINPTGTINTAITAAYDAIVELCFVDRAAMEKDMNGPGFQAADRDASSARLMDLANTQAMVMEEVEVALGSS